MSYATIITKSEVGTVNIPVDRIVEEAKQLSYDDLKATSERIQKMLNELEMLDEKEWDALTSRPGAKGLMGRALGW